MFSFCIKLYIFFNPKPWGLFGFTKCMCLHIHISLLHRTDCKKVFLCWKCVYKLQTTLICLLTRFAESASKHSPLYTFPFDGNSFISDYTCMCLKSHCLWETDSAFLVRRHIRVFCRMYRHFQHKILFLIKYIIQIKNYISKYGQAALLWYVLFIPLRIISCKFNFLVAYWYRLISELEYPVFTTYLHVLTWLSTPNETDLQGRESVSLHLILIFLDPDWQRLKKDCQIKVII